MKKETSEQKEIRESMGFPTRTELGMPELKDVVAGEKKSEGVKTCSFCGKEEREVLALIAGPTSYVCNECVELMVDMIRGLKPDFCVGTCPPFS